MNRSRLCTRIALCGILACRSAIAMFAMPQGVPVERLERNIQAYIAKHPADPQGFYTLGRVHYVAIAQRTQSVGIYGQLPPDGQELPNVATNLFQRQYEPRDDNNPALADQTRDDIHAAVENFRTAISMDRKSPVYHLSLASLLESAPPDAAIALGGFPPGDEKTPATAPALGGSADDSAAIINLLAQAANPDPGARKTAQLALRKMGAPAVRVAMARRQTADPQTQSAIAILVRDYWRDAAIVEYANAFDLSIKDDRDTPNMPILGIRALVSHEAGERYLALSAMRPLTETEQKKSTEIAAALSDLGKKAPGAITPIIFSTNGASRLTDLIDPARTTNFDLDGTARAWRWPWLRKSAGILVWDPQHTGQITSGRQLFGSVTFGLFWRNGYEALRSLDDNGDGVLTGKELIGLSVWFDRNGDGQSQPGEVTPVEQLGITRLSVESTGNELGCPCNHLGVTFRDGRQVPSYDWIAAPLHR